MIHTTPADVLLINTPTEISDGATKNIQIPLAPMFLSAYLKEHNFSTHFLDCNALLNGPYATLSSIEACCTMALRCVEQVQPKIIGLTCLFSKNLPIVIQLALVFKQAFPHIPIVTGGMHPTLFPEELLRAYPSLDAIVLGEGEVQMLALAQYYRDQTPFDSQLDGIAFREGERICVRPKIHFYKNIDLLPVPDYACLDMSLYGNTEGWYNPRHLPLATPVPILTSRSCPNRCNFCAMNKTMGMAFRARSAGKVVDEIEMLYSTYGINYFFIEDDNFTLNKKRAMDICTLIAARKLPIQLDARNGLMVKTLDKELVDALALAGLVRACLAIESGSDYIRNTVIGKHLPEEKIYEVVDLFLAHPHIYLFGFFMMGLPEETNESLQATYSMLEKLEVDGFNMSFVTPYPGTALFEQCRRENLFINMDPDTAWQNTRLWHSVVHHIFVKPYALDVEIMLHWHEKFMNLHANKAQASRAKGKCLKNQLHVISQPCTA